MAPDALERSEQHSGCRDVGIGGNNRTGTRTICEHAEVLL